MDDILRSSFKLDWKQAGVFATHLLEGSRWSRTMYSYQKAIIILMSSEEHTKSEKVVIQNLMKYFIFFNYT